MLDWNLLGFAGLAVLYTALLPVLGFLTATPLFLFGGMTLIHPGKLALYSFVSLAF